MKLSTIIFAVIVWLLLSWSYSLAFLLSGVILSVSFLKSIQKGRALKITILLRAFGIILGGFCAIATLAYRTGLDMTFLTDPWTIFSSTFLGVGLYCAFHWVLQNIVLDSIFLGRDQRYNEFRASGGDVFFDQMPWPFNTDSEFVRQYGYDESSGFRSNPSWEFQCPNCTARVEHKHYACWNCGYNWGKPPWEYTCGECGVRVPEDHHGCWNCGNHGSQGGSGKKNGTRDNRGNRRNGTAPMN